MTSPITILTILGTHHRHEITTNKLSENRDDRCGGVLAIVLNSRLPCILIGIAAGVGLAFTGATMQGYL